MPLTVAGGAGSRGAEHLASALVDLHVKQGWLASLDYSLGSHGGHATARNASRFMQCSLFSVEPPTAPPSMAARHSCPATRDSSGDPARGCTITTGFRCLHVCRASFRGSSNTRKCSAKATFHLHGWTCSSPALLMQTLRSCETFSNSIGLQENPEKTQLVGSSQYRRRRLKEELADQRLLAEKVSSSALVLGCSTGKAHCIQKKEKQRIEAAKALYARQSILPVKHRTKLNDQRSLGVSKAAYGWVANTSPQSHSTDHDKMARKASRPFTQVAINLHNLQVVIGTRQVLLWLKRKCMESWTWQQDRASQIAQEARQWLTDRGWEQIRQGWHHPVLGKELHTAFAQGERWIPVTAKSIAHLCREGWRTQQWEEFLHSGRRESRILGLWPYDEVRFSHVRKIAQETQGAALAILYGAVSPACFGLRP